MQTVRCDPGLLVLGAIALIVIGMCAGLLIALGRGCR